MLVRPASFSVAAGAPEATVFHRASDRAALDKHPFAALLADGIEALAAELQQRVALAIAQLDAADHA